MTGKRKAWNSTLGVGKGFAARRKPFTSSTPLPRGDKPLGRNTELPRSGAPMRAQPPADKPRVFTSLTAKPSPMSPAERDARDLVGVVRSGGACEVARPGCAGVASDYQHMKRRPHCKRSELWNAANGLAVCRPCHEWIGSADGRPVAAKFGWHLESWQTPGTVPTLIHGRWWLLAPDGTKTVTGPPEQNAA